MLALSLQDALGSAGAQTMQAVPNMLEIVPKGVNKVNHRLLDLQASSAGAVFQTEASLTSIDVVHNYARQRYAVLAIVHVSHDHL